METGIQTKTKVFLSTGISHIRKNHALEHASIHVLTSKKPDVSFGGYSYYKGFWLFGKAEIQEVQEAVDVARARLINGERNLAVHKNCGTNLAVTGIVTAIGSLIALSGQKEKKNKVDQFSALTIAGIVSGYAGPRIGMFTQQKFTTDPNVSDLAVVGITESDFNGTPLFFVETKIE